MSNRVVWRLGDWTAEYLLHCRVAKNLSPHSLRAYAIDLADFELWFGASRALEDVDRSAIRGFLTYLTGPKALAPASVKRRIACLKSFFKWAELEGGVECTPFYRLELRLKLPKRLPRALEDEDLKALRRAGRKGVVSVTGSVDRTIACDPVRFDALTGHVALELLYATGVRVSELCAIGMVGLEECGVAGIRILGKGNRERWVPLVDDSLRELISDYMCHRRGLFHHRGLSPEAVDRQPALLVMSTMKALTPAVLRAYLARLSDEAGLSVCVTPHVLRHTAATHYLRAGLDLRHTQRLLGHASVSTTEIYTAVSDKSLEAAMRQATR